MSEREQQKPANNKTQDQTNKTKTVTSTMNKSKQQRRGVEQPGSSSGS
jgi:hypothetical protein